MKSSRIAALLLGAVLAAGSAPASAVTTETVNGSVQIPTFASPAAARLMFAEAAINGITGYVFRLAVKTGHFTLTSLGGTTGLEDFDVNFYRTIDQHDLNQPDKTGWITGAPVGDILCSNQAGSCSGTIPSGAAYAIVTLSAGYQGNFRYTASS